MNERLKDTPGVYLLGFMGSGKTTIGKLLAERLGWHFVDIDDDVEAAEKRSIAEIFDTLGEEEFRRMESDAIARRVQFVASGRPTVMALGGGAATQPANVDLIENHGVTIWLSCPFDVVLRRVGQDASRPLARDPKQFEELFQARQQAYSRANFRIEIETDDAGSTVDRILKLPLFK